MSLEKYNSDDEAKEAFFQEFEQMRPDLVYMEGWTDHEKRKAADILRPTRVKMGMLSSIPMTCQSSDCPFAQSCPLYQQNIAPKGKKCPIEMSMVMQFFNDYVEELGVDVNRMVEVSQVRELVDQEIQHMRKTWLLSQEHFIQENVVGIDAEGNVITKKELHQAVDYEDKILKRKERLRNALVATREAKNKAGQSQVDAAQAMANIMQEVRVIETARQEALRRKLGILENDEYIEDAELEEDLPELEG